MPKVGAIICWSGGSDGYGHVAIVTGVKQNRDGTYTINTLNSAYKSTMYYERKLTSPFNFKSYTCQGFIYCPFVTDSNQTAVTNEIRPIDLLVGLISFVKHLIDKYYQE